jgi:hypothetical protein
MHFYLSNIYLSYFCNKKHKRNGVVIIPEEKCIRYAKDLNDKIASNLSNYWHVKIYHGAYQDNTLSEIKNRILKLNPKVFQMKMNNFYTTSNRLVDWGV